MSKDSDYADNQVFGSIAETGTPSPKLTLWQLAVISVALEDLVDHKYHSESFKTEAQYLLYTLRGNAEVMIEPDVDFTEAAIAIEEWLAAHPVAE